LPRRAWGARRGAQDSDRRAFGTHISLGKIAVFDLDRQQRLLLRILPPEVVLGGGIHQSWGPHHRHRLRSRRPASLARVFCLGFNFARGLAVSYGLATVQVLKDQFGLAGCTWGARVVPPPANTEEAATRSKQTARNLPLPFLSAPHPPRLLPPRPAQVLARFLRPALAFPPSPILAPKEK